MAEASGLWFQPGGLAEASGAFLAGSRGRQVQGAGEWTGGGVRVERLGGLWSGL